MYGGRLVADSRTWPSRTTPATPSTDRYREPDLAVDPKNKFNFFYHLTRRNLINDSS